MREEHALPLGLFLARTETAAPTLKVPLGMLLEPLRRDLLPSNEAAHWARDLDRRLLFVTNAGSTGKTDDENKRDHLK
jgi:hypothetical protein